MLTVTPHDAYDTGVLRNDRMQPVSFAECLGWLHTPPNAASADTAIVLCPGLRTDGLTGYRPFRLLADALAQAGYPTLRFDYPGTGDSCDPGAAEHWGAWLQSIHTAADWLRAHSGAQRVVLCGLRIGATLAALVAESRADVAGLVLIAPVLRGRSYIRQINTEANIRHTKTPAEDGLVANELKLSPETVRLMNQVDLRNVALRPACRVAVYAQDPSPVLTECAAAWSRSGAAVACNDFAGLEPMLRPSFMNHEAPAEVVRIVAWLRQAVPVGPAPIHDARIAARAEIRPAGCIETPLRFGGGGNLFGVMCRPADRADTELVVVIVNSSGDPHYGPARVAVDLARRLAAEGVASLRMDFEGVGDSVAPNDAQTHVFETDRQADVVAALDALEDLGYRRFAIQGLCSGAYHAFHAALADPRIGELLLVNLPMFQWRKGDAIEFMSHTLRSPVHYLPLLSRKDIWMRLLQQGRLGLRTRLAMQRTWLASKVKAAGRRHARLFGFRAPPTFAQDSLCRLSQRARTLLLFSEGDAGIAALAQEFGADRSPPGAKVSILPGLDHSLSGSDMRRIVAEQIIGFLKRTPASPRQLSAASRPPTLEQAGA